MVDIATRVHNHNWKIDPIVRSLIDTDFYKLLMCQSIFRNKPDTEVTFSLLTRSTSVRLADLIEDRLDLDRLVARLPDVPAAGGRRGPDLRRPDQGGRDGGERAPHTRVRQVVDLAGNTDAGLCVSGGDLEIRRGRLADPGQRRQRGR